MLAASIWLISKLELRSSFTELLPRSFRSVKDLDKVMERVGGNDRLMVVIESPDFDANKTLVDAIVHELEPLTSTEIKMIFYKTTEAENFYKGKFLYFFPKEKLQEFYENLSSEIKQYKQKLNPFYIELDEDEAKNQKPAAEILGKEKENYSAWGWGSHDGYLGYPDGKLLLINLQPFVSSTSVEAARALIKTVNEKIETAKTKVPKFSGTIGLAGNVKSTVEEYEILIQDIFSTASICFILIVLALFLYFMVTRYVLYLSYILIFSAAVTFGITELVIGYLNAQTAFLGSLIVGTGINYSIIFIGRYNENRRRISGDEAIENAFRQAFVPTLLACLTTVASFLTLCISVNRGLSQFGFIGSLGVTLCWAFMLLLLPPFLATFPVRDKRRLLWLEWLGDRIFSFYAAAVARTQRFAVPVFVPLLVIFVVALVHYFRDPIEYDFLKLRNKATAKSGTEALEKRVSKMSSGSMTPALLLVNKKEQALQLCDSIRARNEQMSEERKMLGKCRDIFAFLPSELEAKRPILKKIDGLMEERLLKAVPADKKGDFEMVKKAAQFWDPTVNDLPDVVRKQFVEKNGAIGTMVFVDPKPGKYLSNGRNLFAFSDLVQNHTLSDGTIAPAASGSLILSDLIRVVQEDGPKLSVIAFSLVLILLLLMVSWSRDLIPLIVALVVGIGGMFFYIAVADIKMNFFNFIALPLTFGIGVDYPINVYYRLKYTEGSAGQWVEAIKDSALSVGTCSITTVIGYASLVLGSSNMAVESFAKIALAGEFTCYGAAILIVPWFMVKRYQIEKQKGDAGAAVASTEQEDREKRVATKNG